MHRLTSRLVWVVAIGLVAGCGDGSASPSSAMSAAASQAAVASGTPLATSAATPAATPTAAPTPTASHGPARWVRAGTMHLAHTDPCVIPLSDGRVLVFGNAIADTYRGGPPDDTTTVTELWSPDTNAWKVGPPLPKPRDWASVVTLQDGQPMVIGGVNASWAAYSSAYRFDPGSTAWVKTGLLGTARYWGAAVVLRDGRVLVAGGRYSSGYGAVPGGDVTLAAYGPIADVDPGPPGHSLALAEVYDPGADAWTSTGSMRMARDTPSAELLADGRVLVVGGVWDEYGWEVDAAEVWDPGTGKFTRTGAIPAPSLAAVKALGVTVGSQAWSPELTSLGSLTDSGGKARLVEVTWTVGDLMRATADVAFNAAEGRWSIVGNTLSVDREDPDSGEVTKHWGPKAKAVPTLVLSDGRQIYFDTEGGRRLDVYDPASGGWSRLPSVPVKMSFASPIELADGSILMIPGNAGYTDAYRLLPAN